METQLANKAQREPEAEYQVAYALRSLGHEVRLVGLHGSLDPLLEELSKNGIDLVFNCTEAFAKNPSLDYVVASTLEAAGYRYTGAPPLSLLLTRNKALSKKLLSYGIRVPGSSATRANQSGVLPSFPLIVKPLELGALGDRRRLGGARRRGLPTGQAPATLRERPSPRSHRGRGIYVSVLSAPAWDPAAHPRWSR
jgi:hypothetical protein